MKEFIKRSIILIALIFIVRVIFQFPIEYYALTAFRQTDANRVFSKIDALKILAVVTIFFALYYKDQLMKLKFGKYNLVQSLSYGFTGIAFIVLYYLLRYVTNAYHIDSGFPLLLIWVAILVSLGSAFLSFTVSIFGMSFLQKLYKSLKYELIAAVSISVVLYNILMIFQKQWLFFSNIVSKVLHWAFSFFYDITYHFQDNGPILQINDFAVSIGPPCSGIDSMLLFCAFFAAIYALDYKKATRSMFIAAFVIGFIGVYAINVIRLFLLILVGVHYSPELAVGLFHTNAGWVLFLLYFLCYYYLMKKFIYN